MTYQRKNIAFVFRFLLLLLFVGYYSSITLFFHAHLVNGIVVVHSHPFQRSTNNAPYQSHTHTTSAYVLIHHLNQPLCEDSPEAPALPKPIVLLYDYNICNEFEFVPTGAYTYTQLRAPPAA